MAKKKKNLSAFDSKDIPDGSDYKFGIVVSKWNPEITSSLLEGAKQALIDAQVKEENIKIIYVPGAFELPAGAKMMLQHDAYDGVICLGCVIKGETSHNEYINSAVANGLTQLSILSGKACIFGLLTPNDMQQALDRAGGKHGNKGVEAAVTCLQMASIKKALKHPNKSIGF